MSGKVSVQRTRTGKFRKGVSGNPKGRPKGSKPADGSASAFDIIVDKTLMVTKDGEPREMSVEEALQQKVYQQAIDGSRTAQRENLRMLMKREKAREKKTSTKEARLEIKSVYAAKKMDDAVMILGIGQQSDSHFSSWKLVPWAVQLGLRRRRGAARLTRLDVQSIREGCLEFEVLEWPKGMDDELR